MMRLFPHILQEEARESQKKKERAEKLATNIDLKFEQLKREILVSMPKKL